MKIGELAARAGLRPSAIRYYEQVGLSPRPERANRQRRYAPDALHRLLLVRFAGDMGFSLEEIRIFLSGLNQAAPPGPRWRKLARGKLKEIEASVERARRLEDLLRHLLDCRCATLEVCVERLSLSPRLRAISRGKAQSAESKSCGPKKSGKS